ncbi:hypothetical protein [Streptomyces sp. NPDC053427]|uniref:hypothetical protein n=1 Tax=Streptomyces sp. NPDC053427 TaxID=3365701 RepID=UPI0037D43410
MTPRYADGRPAGVTGTSYVINSGRRTYGSRRESGRAPAATAAATDSAATRTPPSPWNPPPGLESAEVPFLEGDFGTAFAEALALVPAFRQAPRGRHLAHLLLDAGRPLVDPDRPAPDRFDHWSDRKVRETALGHYRAIDDAR